MSLENPIDNNESQQDADRETKKQANHASQEVPLRPTESQTKITPYHCQVTCNKTRDWIDKGTLGLEGFGLFVLIVYTVFTGFMWCANKQAANAATSAAKTAAAALHFDQRAWIVVGRKTFQWKPNERMIFPGFIVNTGKTPAKHSHSMIRAVFLSKDDIPEFDYSPGTGHPLVVSEDQLMYPNADNPLPIQIPVYKKGTMTHEVVLNNRQNDLAMASGDAYILIYGETTYEDVFGVHHWLHNCDIFPSNNILFPFLSKATATCVAYNDIDKNE